jgi:hypothetical protein
MFSPTRVASSLPDGGTSTGGDPTPISFAYTSPQRQPVNTLLVQPIVLAYVGHGFYVKSAIRPGRWAGDTEARRPCR